MSSRMSMQITISQVISTVCVLLDVHVARNEKQSVACGVASSHQDLHKVTSTIDSATSFMFGSLIDNHGSFSSQLLSIILLNTFFQQFSDYWVAEGSIHQFLNTICPYSTFGSILAPMTEFSTNFGTHHAVLNQSSITIF